MAFAASLPSNGEVVLPGVHKAPRNWRHVSGRLSAGPARQGELTLGDSG